ncbi:MAG TPA: DUF4293 domain-containing protein [Flavobacteriales bacterium]|nr:DUF4293 domain-containing protein [Flavobacteriales bacterium]
MLQRIQSIFLLLATVAIAITFLAPVARIYANGKFAAAYTNFGLSTIDTNAQYHVITPGYTYIIAAIELVLLLFCIFQYKRRKLQLGICRLLYGMVVVHAVFNLYFPGASLEGIKLAGELKVDSYGLAFYMPFIALVCIFLAEVFIKRDEKLVKSADRLR